MGIKNTKSSLRNAIIHLNISADDVSLNDEKFWSQIWQEEAPVAVEVIKGISTQETRILRDGSPKNFAKLTYKMVERLSLATGTLCNTQSQQTAVLNAARILIRLIPCIFEDKAWREFFIVNKLQAPGSKNQPEIIYPDKREDDRNYRSYLPTKLKSTVLSGNDNNENEDNQWSDQSSQVDLLGNDPSEAPSEPRRHHSNSDAEITSDSLMKVLTLSTCDLLFCPEFTVLPHSEGGYLSSVVDAPPEDLKALATCDYVWEAGVGFDSNINSTTYYDKSRSELLRLLLTCLSATLYETPDDSIKKINQWIKIFASNDNRHALPLFTSLLNTVFTFKPSKLLPFNWSIFEDNREELVELSIQLLIATLDHNFDCHSINNENTTEQRNKPNSNLFIEYMSRIHRDEDFMFIVRGFKRLLNNRLDTSYLLGTVQQIHFDQELLVLFWKFCNFNRKFMTYLLRTDDVIDIIVPILYHLSENFQDQSKTALIHIGVYNLLILSGERNFGVKLNKSYDVCLLPNIPTFTGSHADLMIIVFHKLILYGLNLNQLYDFMLTIIVNISPYLKTLSLLACKCLIQLFDIFSSPFVLFTEPNYHQLVIFLLEVFNNLIQYQFDGNVTMVYVILGKGDSFINLASLPSSQAGIDKVFNKLKKKKKRQLMLEKSADDSSDDKPGDKINGETSSTNNHNPKTSNQRQQVSSNFQIGATVSSISALSKPNSQQREVSLVATPDLCNVTQAIHPFNTDKPTQTNRQQIEEPSIDFDGACDHVVATSETTTIVSDVGAFINGKPKDHPDVYDGLNDRQQDSHEEQTEEFGLGISAKGKDDNHDHSATKNWKPTPEWVKQYKLSLPLQSILRMLEVLTPQVEQFKQDNSSLPDETATIRFLQASTLVGLLPVPHPILIRKYRTNHQTALWFRTCTWGMIFVRDTTWADTDIKLIKVV